MATNEELRSDPLVRDILRDVAPARFRSRLPCIGGLQRRCSQTNARLLVEELLRRLEDCQLEREDDVFPEDGCLRDDRVDELIRAVQSSRTSAAPPPPQPIILAAPAAPAAPAAECEKEDKKHKKKAKELRELNEELRGALKDSAKTIERLVASRTEVPPAPELRSVFRPEPEPVPEEAESAAPAPAPPPLPPEEPGGDISAEMAEIGAAPSEDLCEEMPAESNAVLKILRSVNVAGRIGTDVPGTVRTRPVAANVNAAARKIDALFHTILQRCPTEAGRASVRERYRVAANRLAHRYMCQTSAFVSQQSGGTYAPCTAYTVDSVRKQDRVARESAERPASAAAAVANARRELENTADQSIVMAPPGPQEQRLAGLWCLVGIVPARRCPDARDPEAGAVPFPETETFRELERVRDEALPAFGRTVRQVNARV